jgi:ADP-ribose pyrophosphatase
MADVLQEVRVSGACAYDGLVLRLEVDRVRLPGGHETVREVVRHPGAAVIVPVCDDGRILLVRQFRYPVGTTLLELPAGKRDGDEDPLRCAQRELAEETGYTARSWHHLACFYTAPGFSDELIHCYRAAGLERAAQPPPRDEDERIEVAAISPAEVGEAIASGAIRDAKTIIGVLLAAAVDGG